MTFLRQIFRISILRTVLFITFVTFTSNIFGQERLIEESLFTFSDLNAKESEKLFKIRSKGMYTSYHLVEIGSLAKRQSEGKITISLPGERCGDLTYKARSVQYNSEQDYIWYGILESKVDQQACYCKLGSITLVSSEFGKIGHITVDDKTYELIQVGEDRFLLGKLNNRKFTEAECGVNAKTPVHSSGGEHQAQPRSNGNCDVRCLVLFTDNAVDTEGSVAAINNRVNLAIAQTNQALGNSEVDAGQLRIELAGVQRLDFVEADEMDTDANRLASNPNAQALRDAFEADIVVLLTDGPYEGVLGVVRAIGPEENSAFAIVETGAATTGRFTFAHEVAHLFGCGHNDDPRGGIPHGHSFKTGNFLPCVFGSRQRTILHKAGADDVRIQHYSNPDVEFDGQETGKSNTRENARQLINEACVVAQFRETLENFAVFIRSDQYVCPCYSMLVSADVQGGTAGLTYDHTWFRSTDGINWSQVGGNQNLIHISGSCSVGDVIFIRIETTASDGSTASHSVGVQVKTSWANQNSSCFFNLSNPNPSSNVSISAKSTNIGNRNSNVLVSPNPTNGYTEIFVEVNKELSHTISIKDRNGRIISTVIDGEVLTVGTHRFPINVSKNGLFYIHIVDQDGNQTVEKLLKL